MLPVGVSMPYRIRVLLVIYLFIIALFLLAARSEANATTPPHTIVPMPEAIVLIVCKTTVHGPGDDNSKFTGWQDREWAYEHSMMVCRREEVSLYDPDVDKGALPQSFTPASCWRSAMQLGPGFDAAHKNSSWRFWRAACPVPIVRKNPDGTEDIIAWKMPDCGHRDTVICEVDTEI